MTEKEKLIKWTSFKWKKKTSSLQETWLRKGKGKPQTGRKYLPNTNMIRDLYPELIKTCGSDG